MYIYMLFSRKVILLYKTKIPVFIYIYQFFVYMLTSTFNVHVHVYVQYFSVTCKTRAALMAGDVPVSVSVLQMNEIVATKTTFGEEFSFKV